MQKTKTVLITGASSGIGRATAKFFLQNKWNVIITMKDASTETEFEDNDRVLLLSVDVTDSQSIERAFSAGFKKFGTIDVVVNNAGYGLLGPLEYSTQAQVRKQFETNLFSIIDTTRIAVPHLRKAGGGMIINISSMMGRVSLPYFSLYISTKFAVEGLSEALWYELHPQNISIKLIEPGAINTRFFADAVKTTTGSAGTYYDTNWNSVFSNTTKRGVEGADPAIVAKMIYHAATDGTKKFRYVPDRTAKLLLFFRKISSLQLFQYIVSKTVR